jgi:preprotein translocase subunit SecD
MRPMGTAPPAPRWFWWLAGAAVVAALITTTGAAVLTYSWAQRHFGPSYRPNLVYTRWVADQKVDSGPEPGYKPEFTGLTGRDISAARANLDASGTAWVIDITFTPHGSALFSTLTRANVVACPGDPSVQSIANCAGRNLTIWLDLTQTDIDNWEDSGYVSKVSGQFDIQCLARHVTSVVCPKLVTNPITLEEIDGGQAEISGAFNEQSAKALASGINSRAR